MRGLKALSIIFLALSLALSCSSGSGSSSDSGADTTPPTISSSISFSGTSSTATTATWGAASDDQTRPSSLQYKLVKAASAASIDTVAKADAIKGGDLVMDWTVNALGRSVSGLSPSTSYFFAVLVRDEAGNKSIYAPKSVTTAATADTTPPTVGTDIAFSSVSGTALTVSWGAATDDITPAAGLRYKLVKASASTAIDSVVKANAISGADLAMDWTAAKTSASVTGLTLATTYYFAVIVQDAAGNMSLYAPKSAMTTTTADTAPPTIGTAISFSGTAATGTTISWGAATDDTTGPTNLQYKLVMASASADIATVALASAISSGTGFVMDWTAATTSKAATGLSPSTTYWFAVLVRDAAGNMSLYAPRSVATSADTTAPSVGGTIGISGTTATGTELSWNAATDNVTAQTSLQYKLVKATTSTAIDTPAEANAITGGDLVMDWTTSALSKSATGLSDSTTYWFAVLVRDAAGNMSLYAPQSVTTLDATPPTAGTAIAFSAASATSATVSWGAATDNVTAQASLQYKLVKASSQAAIDSVAEVNAVSGADLVMDWTAATTSKAATGLSPSTTYWFAVIAKDAAGNMSLYAPQSVATTADTTAPAAGTGVSFSGTTATGTTVSWGAATDNVTAQANLQYKLVKASASTAIDTVAGANAIVSGADLVMDWTAATTSKAATGLSPSTTYWFAVIVKDAAGNMSLYAPQSVATTVDSTVPTIGTAISASGTTYTSTTLSWGAASDNVTPAASLRYKLVMASASTAIDTVAEANAIVSGTGLVMDWTNNTLTKSVTGLTDGTTYYFSVIVQDAAGNMSLYTPVSVTTPVAADTTAPTVGTGIVFSSTSLTGTTVGWGAASDNVTAQASLQYKLVKASTSAAINSVALANAVSGGDLVMDWTANVTSKAVTGLSTATTYYFAVVVKDAAGNMNLYSPQPVTTLSDTTAPTTGTAISFANISSTSLTASWGAATDNVTAQSNLQYKLVKASSLGAIETVALANAITGANLVMDWTTNATTKSVTGLAASTYYYFSVIVRDGAGNMSLYDVKWAQTSAVPDTTAPSVGSGITFSGISSNTVVVSWGAGSDDVTAQTSLQYRLVKASASTAIDTVAEANAITGSDLVMDWSTNATSATATGLSVSTTYYFSVVVRDATGNASLYSPLSVTTTAAPDTTAPTTGTGISFSGTTSTGTTVNWGAGSDNVTPQASLQYKLVRATASASIDTVAEADAISDANLIMDWTANTTSKTVSGLTAGTTYYFAAIVKDATGNKSLYAPASVTTSTTGNIVYSLSTNPGWTVTGNWQWGTVTYDDGNGYYPTGSVVYGTGLAGPYSANMTFATNYVQAGPLNFSAFSTAAGFRMNFQGWIYVQPSADFAGLQYSTDGTNFTLVPASCVSGYAYCPNPDPSYPQEVWSPNWGDPGSAPAWRSITIDLGGLALNGKTTVYFRWVLSSSPSVQKGGFFIKNIDIGY